MSCFSLSFFCPVASSLSRIRGMSVLSVGSFLYKMNMNTFPGWLRLQHSIAEHNNPSGPYHPGLTAAFSAISGISFRNFPRLAGIISERAVPCSPFVSLLNMARTPADRDQIRYPWISSMSVFLCLLQEPVQVLVIN